MNTIKANVTEVARNFSDYINRACYGGENFVLIRGGKPVAEINPLPKIKNLYELEEILDSLPKLSENESASFVSDVKTARKSAKTEIKDPWDA